MSPLDMIPPSEPPQQQVHLPDELWLQILTHTNPNTTWLILRLVSRQLHSCIHTYATQTLLPEFTLSLVYSLGVGSSHRWYDIRATVTLAFAGLNKVNSQYARFNVVGFHPDRTGERAREKWRRLCRDGFGPEVEWRVRFSRGRREVSGGPEARARGAGAGAAAHQSWRVLFGIDGPADFGYVVKMKGLVVGEDDEVWVDWKEMLSGYFSRESRPPRQVGEILTATASESVSQGEKE